MKEADSESDTPGEGAPDEIVEKQNNEGQEEEDDEKADAAKSEADSQEKKWYVYDKNIPDISEGEDVIIPVEDRVGEDPTKIS